MRRKTIYLVAMAAIAIGCQAELEQPGQAQVDLSKMAFTAVTEQSPAEPKTSLSPTEGSTVCNIHWTQGDLVLVSDGTTSAEYSATPGTEDPTYAGLSTTAENTPSEEASDYYAVFPSVEGAAAGPDGYTVVIPSSQTWVSGKFDMPMVGKGGQDKKIAFMNAASILKITPNNLCDSYDGVRVKTITVSSETNNIAGTCAVTYDGESAPVVGEVSEGSKTITLDCGAEGAEFDETFYISLIPGTYDALTVTITSNGGGSQTFTIPADKEYPRSKYAAVALKISNLAIYESANCYLVKHAGTYKFPVNIKGNGVTTINFNTHGTDKKVSSSTPTEVFSASVDASNGTMTYFVISQQDMSAGSFDVSLTLQDITHNGDYVSFTVPENFTPGNVQIALMKKSDPNQCMWSWHIWVNDQVEDVSLGSLHNTYAPHVEIMNMNLGSLQTSDNLASYAGVNSGLYYQWGRKDPFPPYNGTDVALPSPYSYDENCTNATQKRASESIAMNYPTVFYSGNGGDEIRAWCTKSERDHWGSTPSLLGAGTVTHTGAIKTAFDPCPPGYQVMSAFAWKSITYDWSNKTDSYSARNKIEEYADHYMITKRGDKPVFPYDGFRTAGTTTNYDAVGRLFNGGQKPHYWSSSYYNNGSMKAVGVHFQDITPEVDAVTYEDVAANKDVPKSYACSVRAQKQ